MTIQISGILLGGSSGSGGSAAALADLTDVAFPNSLQDGQYLRYNSVQNNWQNSFINSDIYGYVVDNLLGTNGISVSTQSNKHYIGFNLSASGDVKPTTVAGGSLNLQLVDINTAPGTYGGISQIPVITIDAKGRVTSVTTTTVAGGGTVSSVELSGGSTGLSVIGGPITTAGTITLTGNLNVQSGGTGTTGLTGYVVGNGSDPYSAVSTIPGQDIVGDISGRAANITGVLSVEQGGTGSTTAAEAINQLLPPQAGNSGKILKTDGANVYWETSGGAGQGSVTSVAIDGSRGISVTGSPIVDSGTITLTLGVIQPDGIESFGPITGSNLSGTNTGDQIIELTGDVTGTGTGSFATTLSETGVVAGTYGNAGQIPQIVVDSKGRISAISEIGIAESGLGTVTSVAVSGGSTGLITLGGPVTSTGVIEITGTLNVAHGGTGATTLSGYLVGNGTNPVTAVSSIPGSSVSGDISGNSANVTGIIPVSNGGTGVTTVQEIIDLILPSQDGLSGQVLQTDGTTLSWQTISGLGTLTDISVIAENGVTALVTNSTAEPVITIGLGDITPTSVAATGTVTGSNLSGTNTGDQTIELTGDVTGTGVGTFETTLADTGVIAGTYGSQSKVSQITVDSKGRITSANEIDIAGLGLGTVSSVDVSGGTTGLTTTGGPILDSGTIVLDGTLSVSHGGTGADSLSGYLFGNGTDPVSASTTIPGAAIAGDISGNAANVTGIVPVEHGGTGATTLDGILNNALPPQTGQDGKYFKTTGAVTYWGKLTQPDVVEALASAPVDLRYIATSTQGNSIYLRRDTDYTGGTPGWVNSALFIDTYTGPSTTTFEWGLTSRLNNYSTAGENVGAYLQGNKYATGPTWGACVEVNDKTGTNTSSTSGGTVGLEVDVWANGVDAFKQRIGVDVVVGKSNAAGAKSIAHSGVRVGAQNNNNTQAAFLNGFEVLSADDSAFLSTANGQRGLDLRGTYTSAAIDLSNSIVGNGTAIRLKSGTSITFGNDAYRTRYIDTRVEFLSGGTRKAYIDLTAPGDIQLNKTYVSSVSLVPQSGIISGVSDSTGNAVITLGLGDIVPASVAATGTVTGSNLSGINTGDQTIILSGDVTGTGTNAFVTTLATVNSAPQTDAFRKITVNSKGLVIDTSEVTAEDIATALGGPLSVANGGTGTDSISGLIKGNGSVPFTSAIAGTDYVSPNQPAEYTAQQTFNGSTSSFGAVFKSVSEQVSIVTAGIAGLVNFYLSDAAVAYYTLPSTADWQLDISFSPGTTLGIAMPVGQSITLTTIVTQGATAFVSTGFSIDGVAVTPKWLGGQPPDARPMSVDMYTYTIVKQSATDYTVLAAHAPYQ